MTEQLRVVDSPSVALATTALTKDPPAFIAESLTLLGTTTHATARFHIFVPPARPRSPRSLIKTLKQSIIRISPLGQFVSHERYRNKSIKLELLSTDAEASPVATFHTQTDNEGQVNQTLTPPELSLLPDTYQLKVLVGKSPKRPRRKKRPTQWIPIGCIPVKLLADTPPQETQHRAVISDIDGTLYYTAYHTFLQMLSTAYTRPDGKVFIEGMPLLLKTLKEEPNTTLHGLSCSPENLRDFIQKTTARAGFQFDTLQLNKSFNATRSRERIIYKITKALELLCELPRKSTLILLGDNKEQDIQTYELIKELLELPQINPHTHVTAWAAQVIAVANQVRSGTVTPKLVRLIRARLEALALNVLSREHEPPEIFIIESHQPNNNQYITEVRNMATREDTLFCDNGHQILSLLLKKQSQVIRQLKFVLHQHNQPVTPLLHELSSN